MLIPRLTSTHFLTATLTAASILILWSPAASAFPFIRSSFFSAYPTVVGSDLDTLTTSNRTNHCGVCHFNFSGGGPRNPYGMAVEATDRSPAAILALGSLDSDGDGFTNDEEILGVLFANTPTFPGLLDTNLASVSNVDPTEIAGILTPEELIAHNEAIDGDLSDDRLLPDAFDLVEGMNTFEATQQGDAQGRDIDYFTINVAAGTEWTGLVVESFDAASPNNLGFLGVQSGTTFTVDAGSATASDLLGGAVYGATDAGTDIFADVGTLPGATGFQNALPAGDYTIWLNQTGDPSTARLSFIVPEPGAASMLTTGAFSLWAMARRRKT